jgi:hypothetical protein
MLNSKVYRAAEELFDTGLSPASPGIVPLRGQAEFSNPFLKIRMVEYLPVGRD